MLLNMSDRKRIADPTEKAIERAIQALVCQPFPLLGLPLPEESFALLLKSDCHDDFVAAYKIGPQKYTLHLMEAAKRCAYHQFELPFAEVFRVMDAFRCGENCVLQPWEWSVKKNDCEPALEIPCYSRAKRRRLDKMSKIKDTDIVENMMDLHKNHPRLAAIFEFMDGADIEPLLVEDPPAPPRASYEVWSEEKINLILDMFTEIERVAEDYPRWQKVTRDILHYDWNETLYLCRRFAEKKKKYGPHFWNCEAWQTVSQRVEEIRPLLEDIGLEIPQT